MREYCPIFLYTACLLVSAGYYYCYYPPLLLALLAAVGLRVLLPTFSADFGEAAILFLFSSF